MTVAVVGATGLIGRHVVELLSGDRSTSVVATYRSRPPFEMPGVRWVSADLRVPEQATRALHGSSSAVLCAGRVSTSAVLREDPVESVLDTLRIITNILEACAKLHIPRVVLVSSCTIFPAADAVLEESASFTDDPPKVWFGVGWMHRYLEKQLEWYVRSVGLVGSGIVLRPTLVYGPHDDFDLRTGHFLPTLVRKVVERVRPIRLPGKGMQTRNLIHAVDFARAIALALQPSDQIFSAFNVATQDDVSVASILDLLLDMDDFGDAQVVLEEQGAGPPPSLKVSGREFAEATGWRPRISVREGLADVLAWYRRDHGSESDGLGPTRGLQ